MAIIGDNTTMYITKDALEMLKNSKVKIWPREAKSNSDKIIDLVYFYEKYKNQVKD